MWTADNRHCYDRRKLRYPSELTDADWALIKQRISLAKYGGCRRGVDIRAILNGIMYVLSIGWQWGAVPSDLPPRSTLPVWNSVGAIKYYDASIEFSVDASGKLTQTALSTFTLSQSLIISNLKGGNYRNVVHGSTSVTGHRCRRSRWPDRLDVSCHRKRRLAVGHLVHRADCIEPAQGATSEARHYADTVQSRDPWWFKLLLTIFWPVWSNRCATCGEYSSACELYC